MVKKLIGSWRAQSGAQNSGAAAVELSFLLPVLVVLGLGVSDYGALMGSAASWPSRDPLGRGVRKLCGLAAGGAANSDCITGIHSLVTTLTSNTAIASATFTPSTVRANAANYCTHFGGGPVAVRRRHALCDPRVLQYIQIVRTRPTPPGLLCGFLSLSGDGTDDYSHQ
jgi:hypothetical protein